MNKDQPETALLLRRAQTGDREAMGELLTRLYADLKRLAVARLSGEAPGHTLQPTALVNEAYLRLVDPIGLELQDRKHFLCIAGRVMREVLVDHARRRGTRKRGGDRVQVTLEDAQDVAGKPQVPGVDLLALNEALEELAALDSRKAQVVELRFFSGLTFKEAAEVLGISPSTAEADWYGARAWLRSRLSKGPAS